MTLDNSSFKTLDMTVSSLLFAIRMLAITEFAKDFCTQMSRRLDTHNLIFYKLVETTTVYALQIDNKIMKFVS